MIHSEIQMLLAHGVPEAAIVDAVVWGKVQRLMNSAYMMVEQSKTDYLPPTGFANTVQDAMNTTRYAGVFAACEPQVVKAKKTAY